MCIKIAKVNEIEKSKNNRVWVLTTNFKLMLQIINTAKYTVKTLTIYSNISVHRVAK